MRPHTRAREIPSDHGPMKSLSSPSILVLCVSAIAACGDTPESRPSAVPTTALTTHTTQRATIQVVGSDTLSDSARITRVLPEPDGDGIVAQFAEPARRVTAGLAIIDRRMANPQLLWPDSVTGVWWTGSHMLAFTTTTGRGIRLVADVHAATLEIADTADARLSSPPSLPTVDSSVVRRARAYVDSIHQQLVGSTAGTTLTYSVSRVVPSPDGSMAAFHSSAQDPSGSITNPAWFVIDRTSGSVAPLDRITGPGRELPSGAGEWSGNTSFFYAKGQAIWEAEIQRVASTPPG